MTDPESKTTKIIAYRDWASLRDEAISGKHKDVAQFIADNTRDARADDPHSPQFFAPGYVQSIKDWLAQ